MQASASPQFARRKLLPSRPVSPGSPAAVNSSAGTPSISAICGDTGKPIIAAFSTVVAHHVRLGHHCKPEPCLSVGDCPGLTQQDRFAGSLDKSTKHSGSDSAF